MVSLTRYGSGAPQPRSASRKAGACPTRSGTRATARFKVNNYPADSGNKSESAVRISMVSAVSFQNVSRHFGNVRAVDDVSLEIAEGEFFAMLGPSGSGKTTCLRLIAGFEQPTFG